MELREGMTVHELKLLVDHVDYVRGAARVGSRRLTPADRLAIRFVEWYLQTQEGAGAEDEQAD